MNTIISRNVSSFKIDKTGSFCLIKFFPEEYNSEENIKKTLFYTVIEMAAIRAYGGIPKNCELSPIKKIEHSELFSIESDYVPATFEGVSYYGSSKGKFWTFDENPSVESLILNLKQIMPKAESEFKALLMKHIQNFKM
jgi:hypothetical protein